MTEIIIHQEREVYLPSENLQIIGPDADWLLDSLDYEIVSRLCLRRGVIAEPQIVKITAEIVQEREFRYGFNGQLRERCSKRTEQIIETQPRRKLWYTKKRGWYWIVENHKVKNDQTFRDERLVLRYAHFDIRAGDGLVPEPVNKKKER